VTENSVSHVKVSANSEYGPRAMAAWFRSGGITPPESNPKEFEIEGKRYIALNNINGVLAVYRIRPSDGVLRRMKRWPSEITQILER
jgi:hypothetical protein